MVVGIGTTTQKTLVVGIALSKYNDAIPTTKRNKKKLLVEALVKYSTHTTSVKNDLNMP